MPRIIPIRDLRDTAEISRMCHEAPDEPIVVTKNGYQDMVILSPEYYEEAVKLMREAWLKGVYEKLEQAEEDIRVGRVGDAKTMVEELREKYGLQTHKDADSTIGA